MGISEKASYLKGLMDGLNLDGDKKETKVLNEIVNLVEKMAFEIDDLGISYDDVNEKIDAIDEDLSILEEDFYDEYDDCDCNCNSCQETEPSFVVECPQCGNTIYLTEDQVFDGSINCSDCGELLEFDFNDESNEDIENSENDK